MDWKESMVRALQESNRMSLQRLKAVMESLDIGLDMVSAYIANPVSLPYGRSSLYRNHEAEAVLIHLPYGKETYIHDHGFSVGCAKVLEGTVANRIYRLDGDGYPVFVAETVMREGSCFFAPKRQIHQLRNVGSGRAVSFHLYAPALTDVRNYYPFEQVLDFVI